MALLSFNSISNYPFQKFTKIYSADMNNMFATIQGFVNGTIAGGTAWITRYGNSSQIAAGTANFAVYNDSNGYLTEAAQMPIALGGLGSNLTPSGPSQAGQSIAVNAAGTGFTLSSAGGASAALYNFYNLG